jgi:hypothetical protein
MRAESKRGSEGMQGETRERHLASIKALLTSSSSFQVKGCISFFFSLFYYTLPINKNFSSKLVTPSSFLS